MCNRILLLISLLACLCSTISLSAQDFYGPAIQEVRIDLPYKNWDYKLDSLKKNNQDARLPGSAAINAVKFDSVGVRYKGNSSYFRTRKETMRKLPMNIRLDFKKRNQKLAGGQTTVKLSNGFLDPSFLRDPLAYEVYKRYMPAPQCNFAKVYINGKYYGLYINTESVDMNFIKRHFDVEAGHLIKCDPDNWKRVRSQTGCPKGENASLAYLNDSEGCYDAFYEVDDAAAWKPLMRLIKILNKKPSEIESVLDVDQTLWMHAINDVIVNLDSYSGSLSHNYYLYADTNGVCHPIIWDLNMAFGGWRRNFSFEEMKDDELIQYSPTAEFENVKRPLISQLMKTPLYRKVYLAHLRTVANDFLKSGKLMARAKEMTKLIDPWVKQDSLKLYSYADFQQAMDKTMTIGPDHVIGLNQLMGKRAEWLLKHPLLTRPQPVISDVKHAKQDDKILITAKMTGAKAGWFCYRASKMPAFKRTVMFDDGTNGDATAGDGIYSVTLDAAQVKHYYLIAEAEEIATTFPERASFEYQEVK